MVTSETSAIYLMHKYWGKKPSNWLSKIISTYSNENDTVLDPFAGFGGFGVESILQNRNVILNDLNPCATFIAKNVLNKEINISKFKFFLEKLKKKYSSFAKEWYEFEGNEIYTILRDASNRPLKLKIKKGKKTEDIKLSNKQQLEFLKKENEYVIKHWYPNKELIENSRISAKRGMRISDLFPKRALICHAFLYNLISQLEECPEKDLLLFTFTSNIANCSKLVPPISSRGDMAQGAWMTGFYIGATYLENNVFHYFENRAIKSINGKETYLALLRKRKSHTSYTILNNDAKHLPIKNNAIDFVFTDFPYGDTVPYFEQSQLWNYWLKYNVDYSNEIVISNSDKRNKNIRDFEDGINKSISEISRVLKDGKYFVFTFHSLSDKEWSIIIKSLKKYNFFYVDCKILIQKTLPPRQLNRVNSIKGDIIVICKKISNIRKNIPTFEDQLFLNVNEIKKNKSQFDINELVILIIKTMLSTYYYNKINFDKIINAYFIYDKNKGLWRNK